MSNKCKYVKEVQLVSYDLGTSWQPTGEYRKGDLIEYESADCAYVPPTPEPQYRTLTTATTCVGYDKYVLSEYQVSYDSGTTWETTGTSATTLIEANSEDCGYVPPTSYKFTAEYSGGTSYSAECDSSTELTTATTRPSGYQYDAMTSAVISCVTSIGKNAFNWCTSLSSVTLPNSLTSIGENAFNWCTSLSSVTLPNSLTSIGGGAFSNCRSLTSVTIPNSVTSIGEGAFGQCYSLSSITIPSSIAIIRGGLFWRCSGLTSVNIGSGVTEIKTEALRDCTSLQSIIVEVTTPPTLAGSAFNGTPIASGNGTIYVPCESVTTYKSDTYWGTYANQIQGLPPCSQPTSYKFTAEYSGGTSYSAECDSSTELTQNDTDPSGYDYTLMQTAIIGNCITSIGEYVFGSCYSLSSVTIPNSVTSIGEGAFDYCSGLTSVTIPNSVTSIGLAFKECSSLTSITINAIQPPTLTNNAFYKTPIDSGTGYIYVPSQSVNAYKSTSGWSYYSSRIRAIS